MKKIYYLYTHTRLDTNEIFYVGVGHTYKKGFYLRSQITSKRNTFWKNVVAKTTYSIQIVNEFDTKEECHIAEIELIKKIGRRFLKEGPLVNIAPGGHYWKESKKIYQYDLEGVFIKEWNNAKEIEKELGITYTNIYASCMRKSKSNNYQFRDFKVSCIDKYVNKQYKEIHQFTKTGKYLQSYNSIVNASKITKISELQIIACATGKIHATKDFIWSYNRCECLIKRLIFQIDENNNIVNTFYSLPHIKKVLNLNSHNSIDNALKGKIQNKAYGYYWKEENNIKLNTCGE